MLMKTTTLAATAKPMAVQTIFPACAKTMGKAKAEMMMKHVMNPATCNEGGRGNW